MVYLVVTFLIFLFGLGALLGQSRLGTYTYKPLFTYHRVNLPEKLSRRIGLFMTAFGLIFMIDALIALSTGAPRLVPIFCFSSLLLLVVLSTFGHTYILSHSEDTDEAGE
jgi:hypothetical protein